MRHPLIDGHGNFGGMGPDEGAAAMRYTECRLAPLALDLLDGHRRGDRRLLAELRQHRPAARRAAGAVPEPARQRLPGDRRRAWRRRSRRTTSPRSSTPRCTCSRTPTPHSDDLMAFVKGPDFPTGAQILGRQGILDAYRTGRGSIRMRARRRDRGGARRRRRSSSPSSPTRSPSSRSRCKINDLVKSGELDGISKRAERLRGTQDRARDQAQARRQRERRAQQALQEHAAADDVRGQLPRAGRRRAEHARPRPGAHALPRPPGGRRDAAQPVPAAQGRGPRAHRRGTAASHRPARRGDRGDPRLRGPRSGARRAHGRRRSRSPRSRRTTSWT